MKDKQKDKKRYGAPKLNNFKKDMSCGCSWGLIFGIMPWDEKAKSIGKKKEKAK